MTSQSVLTLEPKLRPQLAADTQVPRTALLDRLEVASRTPVAAILKLHPGMGRRRSWPSGPSVTHGLRVADDQPGRQRPGVLLRDLAAALDRIEPAGPGMVEAPEVPRAAVVDAVPQLGSALASTALPAVLVLDDLHLLENRDCLDAVTRLIDYLPAGSQLVLASRGEPSLPLARLRAEGRVVEVGPDDLAMDSQEAGSLLEHGHVDADGVDLAKLVRRTEAGRWRCTSRLSPWAAAAGAPPGRPPRPATTGSCSTTSSTSCRACRRGSSGS